jgi:transposase
MAKAKSLVGLDVHASKVVAAMLDAETGELRFNRLPGGTDRTLALCAGLEPPVWATYEAGPTGFGLARALGAAGIECLVAAPGKIPRAAQDRVKTDRRDAEHLVRLLLAGKLEPVRVPASEEEAMRDLVQAREDVRGDLMRARHRVSKMLLRHDQRFSAGQQAWSQGHRDWLGHVELSDPVAQLACATTWRRSRRW